jgi:hypothetical protein
MKEPDTHAKTTRPTPAERQAASIAAGGDGCCHKTRVMGATCPVGWKCPFIKEGETSHE